DRHHRRRRRRAGRKSGRHRYRRRLQPRPALSFPTRPTRHIRHRSGLALSQAVSYDALSQGFSLRLSSPPLASSLARSHPPPHDIPLFDRFKSVP
ncbi:hypothetical protein PLICRDRAFT_699527, partial [Plicaturopsis crispa FD-325 SS-3]